MGTVLTLIRTLRIEFLVLIKTGLSDTDGQLLASAQAVPVGEASKLYEL